LTEPDATIIHSEIARVETSSLDKGAVLYQMARTWASAKQWPEAITSLRWVVALQLGLDPSQDPIFEDL
jgi:hypothetical protein